MPSKNYPDATPTHPFSVQQRLEVLRMIRSRLPNYPARIVMGLCLKDKLTDARNVGLYTTMARCRGCVSKLIKRALAFAWITKELVPWFDCQFDD